ncbi:MAG: hypothetical protein ACHQXL_09590, partial [Candidatus Limnocylindrales bacterium]
MARSRPRPERAIRLTVTANALPPRRASTLSIDHAQAGADLPGRGGPADPASLAAGQPARSAGRTYVPGGRDGGALVAFPIERRIEPAAEPREEPVEARVAVGVAVLAGVAASQAERPVATAAIDGRDERAGGATAPGSEAGQA